MDREEFLEHALPLTGFLLTWVGLGMLSMMFAGPATPEAATLPPVDDACARYACDYDYDDGAATFTVTLHEAEAGPLEAR